MMGIEKVREALKLFEIEVNAIGWNDPRVKQFKEAIKILKQAITELERLRTFKATFDRYELSQKQDYVAYEIMEELQKERREMKVKVKRFILLGNIGLSKDTSRCDKLLGLFDEIKALENELIEWSEENE